MHTCGRWRWRGVRHSDLLFRQTHDMVHGTFVGGFKHSLGLNYWRHEDIDGTMMPHRCRWQIFHGFNSLLVFLLLPIWVLLFMERIESSARYTMLACLERIRLMKSC